MLQGSSGGLWTMENKIRVVPDACCFLSDVQMISLADPERLRIILSAQKKSFSDAGCVLFP